MNKKGTKKKKKLKLRVNVLIRILPIILVLGALFYYVNNLKIKNIIIFGNSQVKDVQIIETANIKNYPNIYQLKIKKITEEIKNIPLVNDVKIHRNLLGKLTIEIKEDKILFFYKYNNKFITSSGDSIQDNGTYYGYPILINFTPDTVFEGFINGLNKVDENVISMINEIEYTPYKATDGTIIDNSRFTLKMNDFNTVIIDNVNMRNLNKYMTVFASLGMDKEKGVVYLDTINDESIYFKSYETIKKEEETIKNQEKKDKED